MSLRSVGPFVGPVFQSTALGFAPDPTLLRGRAPLLVVEREGMLLCAAVILTPGLVLAQCQAPRSSQHAFPRAGSWAPPCHRCQSRQGHAVSLWNAFCGSSAPCVPLTAEELVWWCAVGHVTHAEQREVNLFQEP